VFLSRVRDYPGLLSQLQNTLGLHALAESTSIPGDRLSRGLEGQERFTPADEWAIVGFCENNGLHDLLAQHGVAPPTYDRNQEFDFHADPIQGELRPPKERLTVRSINLFDFQVDFPLGLPACVLTPTHKWIKFYAQRGFDLLTYKTVRGKPWDGHPKPNWALVKLLLDDQRVIASRVDEPWWPIHPREFSMANSFGVPSQHPREWQADVEKARDVLRVPGQVLIVSVMGTPEEADTIEDLADDFANVAGLAKEAGAQIIEANLSCPNTGSGPSGEIYKRPDWVQLSTAAIPRSRYS